MSGAPKLKLLAGRGENEDGQPTDSAGRPIPQGPDFIRGLPDKPDDLVGDAGYMWDQLTAELARVELLKPIDAFGLIMACEIYARFMQATRMIRDEGILATNSQGVVTAPWVGVAERAEKSFRAWCSEYGITPASERRLGSVGNGDEGPSVFD